MFTLYISCFMVTSISFAAAMHESGEMAILRAKLNASRKEIAALQKTLGMDIPLHEAAIKIVGFGATQKEINNTTTQDLSHAAKHVPIAAAKSQRIPSLHACPNRDIQIATHAPRTILHTLKKANRQANRATLESTTPIEVPAPTGLRAEKLPQISQLKSHSATPPVQLCCSYSSYLPSDPHTLQKDQKHVSFGRIEGFNLSSTKQ